MGESIRLAKCYIVLTGGLAMAALDVTAVLPDSDDTWLSLMGKRVSLVECGGLFLVTEMSASELLPLQRVTMRSVGEFTWPKRVDVDYAELGPVTLTAVVT